MTKHQPAWVVRPYPNDKYRMVEFLENRMAAIGWPSIRCLKGCDRVCIRERLRNTIYQDTSPQSLGQAVGIIDRFVNQIKAGDAIAVPDGEVVYLGVVSSAYKFQPELQSDQEGYPHWIGVEYKFEGKPLSRHELPAALFDSLKGRQTVFGLPADVVWDVINNQNRYLPVDPGVEQKVKIHYRKALGEGRIPGINSPCFEEAVRKVLSLYYPGLVRLATTNSPVGADTDLRTALPGGVVVRIQVKCYQDTIGPLSKDAVNQLRNSMEEGEHGILVTSGRISDEAYATAESDSHKPIGLISGDEFVDLVFENREQLTDADLWALGLRRAVSTR